MRCHLLSLAVLVAAILGVPAAPAVADDKPAPAADPSTQVSGTVVERIDAAGYSYLRLETPAGERWAAVPVTTVDSGAKVTVVRAMLMEGFSSKTLGRKWDKIWFGELAGAVSPAAAPPPAAVAPAPISGKVLERIDASSYTYLRLKTKQGEVWAAVPQTTLAVGAKVTVVSPAPMTAFESKTLGRKWDLIYFGRLKGAKATAAAPPPAKAADVKVDKAPGPEGRTVAEVWAQRAALKDKKVVVRGKVVKLVEVKGKSWLHLRDGSGSASGKDDDLTAATSDRVAEGDVVTVAGVLRLDWEFGSGYKVPLIVADATVSR